MPSPRVLSVLALTTLAACSPPIVEGTSEDPPASTASGPSSSEPEPSSSSGSSDPDTTAAPTSDDPTTAGPTDSETSTGPQDLCGNNVIDPGELCDDGNIVETDDCTSLCAPPSCDDGLLSGDEKAVDCGGSTCDACGEGAPCTAKEDCESLACDGGTCTAVFESCRQLHDAHPGLPDEAYDIDPGLDGGALHVYCDMVNGGWTEIVKDPLESGDGWSLGPINACGDLADPMLGPFGQGEKPAKMFNLLGVPHERARGHVTFIIIDSWDGERALVSLDGDEVGTQLCHSFDNPGLCAINDNQCGSGIFNDGRVEVVGQRNHNTDTILVELSSTLNEAIDNEAFGVDLVSVFVY